LQDGGTIGRGKASGLELCIAIKEDRVQVYKVERRK
jgi:hypothetical protein